MRVVSILIVALAFSSCARPEDRRRAALMQQVDRTVRLPSGSGILNSYKRYYTYGDNGDVLGMFVSRDFDRDAAGERQWVENYKRFPIISDGGCGVVNVRFNVKTSKSETWCNGVA